jgi:hypothetical protein
MKYEERSGESDVTVKQEKEFSVTPFRKPDKLDLEMKGQNEIIEL